MSTPFYDIYNTRITVLPANILSQNNWCLPDLDEQ